jgi:hypothetical protein
VDSSTLFWFRSHGKVVPDKETRVLLGSAAAAIPGRSPDHKGMQMPPSGLGDGPEWATSHRLAISTICLIGVKKNNVNSRRRLTDEERDSCTPPVAAACYLLPSAPPNLHADLYRPVLRPSLARSFLCGRRRNLEIVGHFKDTWDRVCSDVCHVAIRLTIDHPIELNISILHRNADRLRRVHRIFVQ